MMRIISRALTLSAITIPLTFAAPSRAATIQRLAPAGSLGRVEFKHLKANDAGDFVAVTNTKVFVGNGTGVFEITFDSANIGFSLDGTLTSTTTGTDPNGQLTVDAELFNTRADINANGDFVVASNRLLWIGNTHDRTLKQVADGGAFTQFQAVKINDAGAYIAVSDRQIFAGNVATAAAANLLAADDAVGNFGVFDLVQLTRNIDVTAGEQRLQLNQHGQFIAITGSAVYGGQVGDAAATKIYEERFIGFRHAALTEAGTFVIVAESDVFGGSL